MADMARPDPSDKEKAEGDRSTAEYNAERNTDIPNSESSTDREYPGSDRGKAAGITNRPIDEEVENQNTVPERGKSQKDERTRRNDDIER